MHRDCHALLLRASDLTRLPENAVALYDDETQKATDYSLLAVNLGRVRTFASTKRRTDLSGVDLKSSRLSLQRWTHSTNALQFRHSCDDNERTLLAPGSARAVVVRR